MINSLLPMLNQLTPTQLENLAFDLLQLLGLRNCVWRTPGRDGGRDIQGASIESDFSGHTRTESWYVDCKRYANSVAWPVVWEKISYAESNDADVLLVVTNSSLSPQAIDEVNRWNQIRKKPSVRFWNGTELESRLRIFPELLVKYGLSRDPAADAAASLLPLTRILMKYSNAAAAAAVFESHVEKYYEVTHAVSELISVRLEEIENTGGPKVSSFRPEDDSYVWLPMATAMQMADLDRYVCRALVSLLRCHGACPSQAHKADRRITVTLEDSYNGSDADLKSIAFWGGLRVELATAREILEIEHD